MGTQLGWIVAGVIVAGGMAAGQSTRQSPPALTIESLAGRDTFEFYCAPCHGVDGRGGGPVATALSTAPPDLTLLAARHGGTFPAKDVREFVTGTGRPIAAHGSSAMPIWGPTFRSLDPSDTRVRVRITNVVKHIESIQQKSFDRKGGR
jgi:mono/diheme cytochrome c family protein